MAVLERKDWENVKSSTENAIKSLLIQMTDAELMNAKAIEELKKFPEEEKK